MITVQIALSILAGIEALAAIGVSAAFALPHMKILREHMLTLDRAWSPPPSSVAELQRHPCIRNRPYAILLDHP
ncbi:MAG TPA: hypothetical protein VGE05_05930 [Novosphingobium sp.]